MNSHVDAHMEAVLVLTYIACRQVVFLAWQRTIFLVVKTIGAYCWDPSISSEKRAH